MKRGKQKVGSSFKCAKQDVVNSVRLLEYNEKEKALKMMLGKKVGLQIFKTATTAVIRKKAEEKWKAYYSNLYYVDGQKVNFLPETNETFSL